jgi:hypothetical protein
MGYFVLDGCLPRCGDVWETVEDGDDSGDSMGIRTNYIKLEIITIFNPSFPLKNQNHYPMAT